MITSLYTRNRIVRRRKWPPRRLKGRPGPDKIHHSEVIALPKPRVFLLRMPAGMGDEIGVLRPKLGQLKYRNQASAHLWANDAVNDTWGHLLRILWEPSREGTEN